MAQRFLGFIKGLINLGTKNQPLADQPATRLINGIALLGVMTVLLTELMLAFFTGFDIMSFSQALFYTLMFSMLCYLNYLEKWEQSKYLLIFCSFTTVFAMHFSYPYEVSSWFFFICIFAFYAAIFNSKKQLFFYCLAFSILTIISIVLQKSPSHEPIVQYSEEEILGLQIIIYICSCAFVLLTVLYVKSNLIDHQLRLEKVLDERNLLLKEVHHRVKNNLQVVSSLFNLQERRLSPSNHESREIINSSQGRIQSMAIVHQQLYNNPNFKTIKIKAYIEHLVHHLKVLYEYNDAGPDMELNLDDSLLPLEAVTPVGLIINETLTNSFKHAFPDGAKGTIKINYHSINDLHSFSIEDNGIGYQKDLLKDSHGIGNQLIADMADQLHAKYDLETSSGVKHTIEYSLLN